MFKKIVVLVLSFSLFLLCACSKEQKFGIDELVARMNGIYETELKAESFVLGKKTDGSEYLFSEKDEFLIAAFPDSNNTIKGIAVLSRKGGNLEEFLRLYRQMCSVLTGADEEEQKSTLTNCGISEEKIKFADSTTINTVGKYKYVSVCNEYAVTLFCERV